MYAGLPERIRLNARKAYRSFRNDPSHPGLNFKKVDKDNMSIRSAWVLDTAPLGRLEGDEIVWFWIGPHSEYDQVV
jgi:hypothetical protein